MYYHYKFFKNDEEHWPNFEENKPKGETENPGINHLEETEPIQPAKQTPEND